jgi:hypothetical protein
MDVIDNMVKEAQSEPGSETFSDPVTWEPEGHAVTAGQKAAVAKLREGAGVPKNRLFPGSSRKE